MMNNIQKEFFEKIEKMNLVKYARETTNDYGIELSMPEVRHVAKCMQDMAMRYAGNCGYGHFVNSLHREDFMKAFLYADNTNVRALPIYMHFIYNEVPISLRNKKS